MRNHELNKIISSKTGESKIELNPNIKRILASIAGFALVGLTTINALAYKPKESEPYKSAIDYIATEISSDFEVIEEEEPKSVFASNGPITVVDGIPWYTTELEYYLDIECENLEDSPIVEYIVNNYMDIIEKASAKYGMSPNLIIAIIAQESNGKVDVKDGLMQIVASTHMDELRKTYNFMTGEYEKFVLTNNPSKYKDDVVTYTLKDLEEPDKNIMFGTATFAYYYDTYSDRNLFSALNSYNKGPGRQKRILEKVANDYDVSIDYILSDPLFVNELLPYDDHIDAGDPRYIERIVRYIPNASTEGVYKKYIKNGVECKDVFYIEKTLEKNIKK